MDSLDLDLFITVTLLLTETPSTTLGSYLWKRECLRSHLSTRMGGRVVYFELLLESLTNSNTGTMGRLPSSVIFKKGEKNQSKV